MGQTYYRPRPHQPSGGWSGDIGSPDYKAGTAPAYVIQTIGTGPPALPRSASATGGWVAGPLQGQSPGGVSNPGLVPGLTIDASAPGGAAFDKWAVSVKHTLSNVVTICGADNSWNDEWSDQTKRKPFINTGAEAASWATWPT